MSDVRSSPVQPIEGVDQLDLLSGEAECLLEHAQDEPDYDYAEVGDPNPHEADEGVIETGGINEPAEAVPYDSWWTAPFTALLGGAGTGKTFLAKEWAADDPGVVLCATTGIAAINLGGTTINGLLGYYNTDSLRDAYVSGSLGARLSKLKKAGLRRILLDEVSMLDGDQLTLFTKVLDELAGLGYAIGIDIDDDDETNEDADADPVHPVGLTLVGDFAQLPPVKAPFAFESAEWSRYEANTRMLTEIRRQNDVAFIEALRAARRGDANAALEFFADRFERTTEHHFDGPTLLARNEPVDRYNYLRLSELTTPFVTFASKRWVAEGRKPPSEWKEIPEKLPLKVGALVMVLANAKDPEFPSRFLYVNGDLGELVDVQHDIPLVRLQRTDKVEAIVPVTRRQKIPLDVGRRKQLKAEGREGLIDGRHEIVAEITYTPLRLAWATTVHKSQGLSLDRVQINIGDWFFRTPGMVYVALSRARTAEGLRLVGDPGTFRARCQIDGRIQPWL